MTIQPTKKSIFITIGLALMVMLLIFMFSAQTGVESDAVSDPIIDTLISLLVPDFGSMTASEAAAVRHTFKLFVRKGAHFCIYAVLGLLLCAFFYLLFKRRQGKGSVSVAAAGVLAWLCGTAYAATDEFHQTFSSGRSAELRDVMIDSCGCLCGILFIILAAFVLSKLSKAQLSQIIRFLIVGFAVFFVDFLLLKIFWDKLGIMYLIAATISYSIATVVSYFLNMRLVFKGKEGSKTKEFIIFVALCLVALAINALCMWLLVDTLRLHVMIAKVFAEAIVMFWHFFSRKAFLESKTKEIR